MLNSGQLPAILFYGFVLSIQGISKKEARILRVSNQMGVAFLLLTIGKMLLIRLLIRYLYVVKVLVVKPKNHYFLSF